MIKTILFWINKDPYTIIIIISLLERRIHPKLLNVYALQVKAKKKKKKTSNNKIFVIKKDNSRQDAINK